MFLLLRPEFPPVSPLFQSRTMPEGPLLFAISIQRRTPSPEEDAFCDKTLLKSKLLLAVMKFVSIASHSIWGKETHSASMWVMQKVKSEKETGGNWSTAQDPSQASCQQGGSILHAAAQLGRLAISLSAKPTQQEKLLGKDTAEETSEN
ncbi:hypothetical protein llap_12976 [Limosa lapponica baueri]|uniref:Uncharacterized protein n=1 Tax=Limosa lapponica baueri TaxID=1758121 RepID=A0A2I0TSF6_LIMLA|nr:hypothetical protein llap_12976 [Limosa lapponica baueri]